MTTGRDIAFWELFNDKVLRSRLDSLPSCLSFSGDELQLQLPPPSLVLSCFLLTVLVPICLAFLRPRNMKQDHIHTRAALQALLAIVVPTCSLWPSRYIELASVIHSNIDIPLQMIINDTINGVIEFRNPSNDLADLIDSGITVHGHTVRINIGWKWWIKCFEWWMLAKSKSDYSLSRWPRYMLGLSGWSHRNMPAANPLDPFPSPLALSTSCPLLCLDCLPHGKIPNLNAGSKAILEFTAFSPSLRVIGTAQIMSAIPFMISERPCRWPRTVVSVLEQLSALYGPDMVIDSISNVSVDYEDALRYMYKSFSGGQKIRETWGIKAWRLEMFLVALEAALVRRGWIERWAIHLTVQ